VIAFLSGFAVALMLCTFRLRIPEGPAFDVSAGSDFPGIFDASKESSDLNGDAAAGRKNVLAVIGVQVNLFYLRNLHYASQYSVTRYFAAE
jgi:hypothetical protein